MGIGIGRRASAFGYGYRYQRGAQFWMHVGGLIQRYADVRLVRAYGVYRRAPPGRVHPGVVVVEGCKKVIDVVARGWTERGIGGERLLPYRRVGEGARRTAWRGKQLVATMAMLAAATVVLAAATVVLAAVAVVAVRTIVHRPLVHWILRGSIEGPQRNRRDHDREKKRQPGKKGGETTREDGSRVLAWEAEASLTLPLLA